MTIEDLESRLRALLTTQRVAALGTLHDGEPYVSMVPFALLADAAGFAIHVSALAAHTKDMGAHPAVSLMVMAPEEAGTPPQALARVTIQGEAARCPPDSAQHRAAREAYLARFPSSAMTFELPDFSLFVIRPRAVRFVGGFAQAKSFTAEGLARILRTG